MPRPKRSNLLSWEAQLRDMRNEMAEMPEGDAREAISKRIEMLKNAIEMRSAVRSPASSLTK